MDDAQLGCATGDAIQEEEEEQQQRTMLDTAAIKENPPQHRYE